MSDTTNSNKADDLTAERAAALIDKVKAEFPSVWLGGRQRMILEHVIVHAIKTARQEALREGRDYALACVHERAVQLDGFAGSSEMAGVIRGKQSEAQRIADKLDRLASEGG